MTAPSALTSASTTGAAGPGRTPMRPAASPSGPGPIGVVGPVLAVLLGAAGVMLLRDAVVAGSAGPRSWLTTATTSLAGVRPASWMVPAGIVVALVGLWLLVTALRPRTRRSLALTSQTGAFVRAADVARRASAAAQEVDGVLSTRSSATRRKVTVAVETTGGSGIPAEVGASATSALSSLAKPPRVVVRATSADPEGSSS